MAQEAFSACSIIRFVSLLIAGEFSVLWQRSVRSVLMASGKGVGGWLIFIGILLLINLLSWLFDWSFWIY